MIDPEAGWLAEQEIGWARLAEPETIVARTLGAARRSSELAGRTIVITGAVPGYTRDGATAAVVARGGVSPGSVSKKTDALVVGDGAGASKLTKAEQLGVPIVPADEFDQLLATGVVPAGEV